MLNKQEKQILKLAQEYLEKISKICLDTDELYPEEEYYESCDVCHEKMDRTRVPYWNITSDIFTSVLELRTIIEDILEDRLVKFLTPEQRTQRRQSIRQKRSKEDKEIEEEIKKETKLQILETFQRNKWKIEQDQYYKGNRDGFKEGMEKSKMTEKSIILKARSLEGEMNLGFREDLKKELEELNNKRKNKNKEGK